MRKRIPAPQHRTQLYLRDMDRAITGPFKAWCAANEWSMVEALTFLMDEVTKRKRLLPIKPDGSYKPIAVSEIPTL